VRYAVWIYCCKQLNYDFCILQGNVLTVLKQGGQNCSHLRFFDVACQKLEGARESAYPPSEVI